MAQVAVFFSEVAANIKVKKDTTRMFDLLTIHKVEFTKTDVSIDEEAKAYMKEHSQAKPGVLPLLFVRGSFKGTLIEMEEANEDGALLQWLGLDN
ncbi:hypothetical protein BJ741DRAFT_712250 [Chytriomyces cf. hyalinus JEL632]|nr:hypothetical protein BJ741DRAFT_712250 [Chytriomyces cf. hyalinus JEL632]